MVAYSRRDLRNLTVAVVQCTAGDLYGSEDPGDYCIHALKESGLFRTIVMAMPHTDRSDALDSLAERWGVEVFYGSRFNVARRLYEATSRYNPLVVVRVLLKRFYIDLELTERMIKTVLDGYDYVSLSRDVNYEVTADVMSFNALERAVRFLDEMPDDFTSHALRFSPWTLMEGDKRFRVKTLDYRCMWEKERVREIKARLARFTSSDENRYALTIDNPASRYRFALEFLKGSKNVLDIACGRGDGTALIASVAEKVYGVDYNERYIHRAQARYGKSVEFIHGTDDVLEHMDVIFDSVVSLHTMEHIDDDRLFLERIHRRLKKGGTLVLEVPRLMPYPLGEPLYPCHKREYTQEGLEELLRTTGFHITVALGGNRGSYVDVDRAREVFFYLCKKV